MDVFDLDGAKAAVYGLLGMMGIGGIKAVDRIVMAQRERDKEVSALKDDMSAHKLYAAQTYVKKTELQRVHDRIDKLPHETAELVISLINQHQR
jgi:ribosomal protein S13